MSGSYRQRLRRLPSSVEGGEEHKVAVKEISRWGSGIVKIQNSGGFTRRTKNGDKVEIRRNWGSLRYATAERI